MAGWTVPESSQPRRHECDLWRPIQGLWVCECGRVWEFKGSDIRRRHGLIARRARRAVGFGIGECPPTPLPAKQDTR